MQRCLSLFLLCVSITWSTATHAAPPRPAYLRVTMPKATAQMLIDRQADLKLELVYGGETPSVRTKSVAKPWQWSVLTHEGFFFALPKPQKDPVLVELFLINELYRTRRIGISLDLVSEDFSAIQGEPLEIKAGSDANSYALTIPPIILAKGPLPNLGNASDSQENLAGELQTRPRTPISDEPEIPDPLPTDHDKDQQRGGRSLTPNDQNRSPRTMNSPEEMKRQDPQNLIGTWIIAEDISSGDDTNRPGSTVVFDHRGMTISHPKTADDAAYEWTYELGKFDFRVNPGEMDFKGRGTSKAIYRIEDDHVVICWHNFGGDRPTEFDSTEELGTRLLVLRPESAAGELPPNDQSSVRRGRSLAPLPARSGDTPRGAMSIQATEQKTELEGVWQVVESVENGVEFDEDFQIVIRGDELVMADQFTNKFSIDATKDPKQIDLTGQGPHTGIDGLGIYRIEGDRMLLCYVKRLKIMDIEFPRPKSFDESGDDSKGKYVVWYSLRRVAK